MFLDQPTPKHPFLSQEFLTSTIFAAYLDPIEVHCRNYRGVYQTALPSGLFIVPLYKGGYRKKSHVSSEEAWIAETVISGINHFDCRKSRTHET